MREIAWRKLAIPSLIAGLNTAITEIMTNPEPKETRAASNPLLIRWESSPFARACSAIITPESVARISKRIKRAYRGTLSCQQSNP